jgi:hypothetical protein
MMQIAQKREIITSVCSSLPGPSSRNGQRVIMLFQGKEAAPGVSPTQAGTWSRRHLAAPRRQRTGRGGKQLAIGDELTWALFKYGGSIFGEAFGLPHYL